MKTANVNDGPVPKSKPLAQRQFNGQSLSNPLPQWCHPLALRRISTPGSVSNTVEIHIESNSSSNKGALTVCVAIVSLTVVLIAIISALFGAWLVLPFAGLEVALLVFFARLAYLHNGGADSLVISDEYVHLTSIRRSKKSVHSFVRHWTRITLCPGHNKHEPTQLQIGAHGHYQPFGEFLTDRSRQFVYDELNKWVSN